MAKRRYSEIDERLRQAVERRVSETSNKAVAEAIRRDEPWLTRYRKTGSQPDIPTLLALMRVVGWKLKADLSGVIEPESDLIPWLRDPLVADADASLPPDQRFIYGVRQGGVTFHSVRHTMATWLAEWGDESERMRQFLMGHLTSTMTARYTHMAGHAKAAPLARLAAKIDLRDTVQGPVQEAPSETLTFPNDSERQRRGLVRRRRRATPTSAER